MQRVPRDVAAGTRGYGWTLAALFAAALALLIPAALTENGVLGWLGIVVAGLGIGVMVAFDPEA